MPNVFYPEKTPKIKFKISSKPSHQECIEYFLSFLKSFDEFSESTFENMIPALEYGHWKKNNHLFKTGEEHSYLNFIVSGAFVFYKEEKKSKNILGFLTECNFCSPVVGFLTKQPSEEAALCVENCYGLKISLKNFLILMKRNDFASFIQNINLKMLNYLTNRMYSFQSMDAKQRYDALLVENPEVFMRFSSQDIALFLGIEPATLSRIRKEKNKFK